MKKVGGDCVMEAAEELNLTPIVGDGADSGTVDFSTAARI
jgi:hypothetical protein